MGDFGFRPSTPFANFTAAADAGFESGQKAVGENPLGQFIRQSMAALHEKKLLQEKMNMELAGQKELINYKAEKEQELIGVRQQGLAQLLGGQQGEDSIPWTKVTIDGVTYQNPEITKANQRKIPGSQASAIASTRNSIKVLEDVLASMEKDNFSTGPLSFRFMKGSAANAYMQYKGTSKEADFKAKLERFMNEYLTAKTGSQRGFKEMQWLVSAIPNAYMDKPENFLAKGRTTVKELKDMLGMMEETVRSAGYYYEDGQEQENEEEEDLYGTYGF